MKFWEQDLQYHRGCEENVGDWDPKNLGDAIKQAGRRIYQALKLQPSCESPIEVQLGAAILVVAERHGIPICLSGEHTAATVLIPQFHWLFYRSDLAIWTSRLTLLIECDGKDFHSSTDQIDHDLRKDAAARDRGYYTIRFSGSKIYRGADGCAREILASAGLL